MKILVTSDWHLDYWSESVSPPEFVPLLRGRDAPWWCPRARVLFKKALIFGDVRFLCCTLWSDFGLFGTPERSMLDVRWMEDFSRIQRDAKGDLIEPKEFRAAHQDPHIPGARW